MRCEIVVDLALMKSDTSLTPSTTMATIAFRFPPHSIGLDGEPETIKEFAAKQL